MHCSAFSAKVQPTARLPRARGKVPLDPAVPVAPRFIDVELEYRARAVEVWGRGEICQNVSKPTSHCLRAPGKLTCLVRMKGRGFQLTQGGSECETALWSVLSRAGSSRLIELISTFDAHNALHPHHRHIRRCPRSLQVSTSSLQATEARRASELTPCRLAPLTADLPSGEYPNGLCIVLDAQFVRVPCCILRWRIPLLAVVISHSLISSRWRGDGVSCGGVSHLRLTLVWMRVDKAMVGVGIRI